VQTEQQQAAGAMATSNNTLLAFSNASFSNNFTEDCLAYDLNLLLGGVLSLEARSIDDWYLYTELLISDITLWVMLMGALFMAFFGERLAMPCLMLAGFAFMFIVTLDISCAITEWIRGSDQERTEVMCHAPVIASLVSGILGMYWMYLIVMHAIFLLGAFIGWIIAQQMLDTLGRAGVDFSCAAGGWGFDILDRCLAPYWSIILVCAVIGGVIAIYRDKDIFLLATAIFGGWLCSITVVAICIIHQQSYPDWAALLIFISISTVGGIFQLWRRRKKEKEKEEEEQLEQNAMANQENQEKAQRYERDGARNRSPRRHDDGIELQL